MLDEKRENRECVAHKRSDTPTSIPTVSSILIMGRLCLFSCYFSSHFISLWGAFFSLLGRPTPFSLVSLHLACFHAVAYQSIVTSKPGEVQTLQCCLSCFLLLLVFIYLFGCLFIYLFILISRVQTSLQATHGTEHSHHFLANECLYWDGMCCTVDLCLISN